MQILRCSVQQCPYFHDGWCQKKLVAIQPNAQCSQFAKADGSPNLRWNERRDGGASEPPSAAT